MTHVIYRSCGPVQSHDTGRGRHARNIRHETHAAMSGPDEPGGSYVNENPRRPRTPGESLDAALELEAQTAQLLSDQLEQVRSELAEVQAAHEFLARRVYVLERPPSS